MIRRTFILFVLSFVSVASRYSFAEQTTVREQSEPSFVSDSEPSFVSDSEPPYTEPISTRDTIALGDSVVVVHTVCAPICSSHVRVYNKEWEYIGTIKPDFKSAFPEAYIQDEKLYWRDNDTTDYSPVP